MFDTSRIVVMLISGFRNLVDGRTDAEKRDLLGTYSTEGME